MKTQSLATTVCTSLLLTACTHINQRIGPAVDLESVAPLLTTQGPVPMQRDATIAFQDFLAGNGMAAFSTFRMLHPNDPSSKVALFAWRPAVERSRKELATAMCDAAIIDAFGGLVGRATIAFERVNRDRWTVSMMREREPDAKIGSRDR